MSANTVPNNTVRNPTTSAAELHLTPEHIAATALATLPAIGPQRLRLLLDLLGAVDAWRTVRGELAATERIAALLAQENFARIWRQAATDDVLRRVEAALHNHHISVVLATDPLYPSALATTQHLPCCLPAATSPHLPSDAQVSSARGLRVLLVATLLAGWAAICRATVWRWCLAWHAASTLQPTLV